MRIRANALITHVLDVVKLTEEDVAFCLAPSILFCSCWPEEWTICVVCFTPVFLCVCVKANYVYLTGLIRNSLLTWLDLNVNRYCSYKQLREKSLKGQYRAEQVGIG